MTLQEQISNCPLCNGKSGEDVFIGQVEPSHWRIACVPCALEIKHDRKDKVLFHWNNRANRIAELDRMGKLLMDKDARIDALLNELAKIANQKTYKEVEGDADMEHGDYEYAYDEFIIIAREALKLYDK